jgi:branched-chain amino acid transport system permease protein
MTQLAVLPQLVVGGITVGSIYALVALGLVLVYKSTGVVNFAQGDMLTLGAYTGLLFYTTLSLPYPLAMVAAVVSVAAIAMVIERIAVRPLLGSPDFTVIVATLAISIVIRGVLRLFSGDYVYPFPAALSGPPIQALNVRASPQSILTLGIAVLLMVVMYFLFIRTRVGLAMRATAENLQAASLMGVSLPQIFRTTWALSAALGGLAGILVAPLIGVQPEMGDLLLKAFVAALVGGFTSLPGAIVGGLALGILETVAGGLFSNYFKDIVTFALMMAVVVFRPTGLLGRAAVVKV